MDNKPAKGEEEQEKESDSYNGATKAIPEDTKIGDRKRSKWLHKVLISLAVITIIALSIALAVLGSIKLRRLMRLSQSDFDIKRHVRSERYRYASVAAETVQCSQVGTDILGRDGGTVMDAAIATLLCLGVVQMQSTGIGGGFIMTYYNATEKKTSSLIAREVAPFTQVRQDMFVGKAKRSPQSIGVPMEVAGYWEAHQKYGKLPWKHLFQPAISLAENGFNLTEGTLKTERFIKECNIRALMDSEGQVLKAGSLIRLPKLARTLRRIANGGAREFYRGPLAEDIEKDIRDIGGLVTAADLARYDRMAEWRSTVKVHLKNGNYTVYMPPPPSSGLAVGYILNIMDEFTLKKEDFELPDYPKTLHRQTEATKFAFAERAKLGDDAVVDITESFVDLQSDQFARRTREKIRDEEVLHMRQYGNTDSLETLDNRGTTNFNVYGPDGSAASVSGTINYAFGQCTIGRRTGIIFNNELDDFTTPESHLTLQDQSQQNNLPGPGKRPMSSMAPAIVLDGKGRVKLVVGSSGGRKIISATSDAIIKALWSSQELGWVVESPRSHHQLKPNVLEQERDRKLNKYVIRELQKRGHEITEDGYVAKVQAIRILNERYCRDGRCIESASDSRKFGYPDGY